VLSVDDGGPACPPRFDDSKQSDDTTCDSHSDDGAGEDIRRIVHTNVNAGECDYAGKCKESPRPSGDKVREEQRCREIVHSVRRWKGQAAAAPNKETHIEQFVTWPRALDDEFEPAAVQLVAENDRRNKKQGCYPAVRPTPDQKEEPENYDNDQGERFSVQICYKRQDPVKQRIAKSVVQEMKQLAINV